MAHQAHNIRWDVLASNLKYYSPPVINGNRDCRNLHFKRKPHQAKELGFFAESFARSMEERTHHECRKYPAHEPPDDDAIILDDDVTRKITPTMFIWRRNCDFWPLTNLKEFTSGKSLCQHASGFDCGCPVPLEERKASSFLREEPQTHNCDGLWPRGKFFNVELVKILLLYGEIGPVLRVSSHPRCDYRPWQERIRCCCVMNDPDEGWDRLYIYTLNNYICLNVLFSFPELWDATIMTGVTGLEEGVDYRCTAMYQRMLHACTRRHQFSQVATYPHRQFFGIEDDRFCSPTTKYGGQVAFQDFLQSDSSKASSSSSSSSSSPPPPMASIHGIHSVEETLRAMGLSAELIQQVLKHTEYDAPRRRLKVSHDPFHRDNREELEKYLKYCWQLLVWCNMMARAQQVEIDWKGLVARCLNEFFSSPGGERIRLS